MLSFVLPVNFFDISNIHALVGQRYSRFGHFPVSNIPVPIVSSKLARNACTFLG